jgi:hypothetical protein
MPRTLASILVLAALLALPAMAGAQTTTASLQGTVKDASSAVLPGVTVTVRSPDTGFTRTTTSGPDGTY